MRGELERVFDALNRAGVRYLVVGGVAVVLHGHLRTTHDLDLVLELGAKNVREALRVFAALGFAPRAPVPLESFADPESRARWIREKSLVVFSLWRAPGGVGCAPQMKSRRWSPRRFARARKVGGQAYREIREALAREMGDEAPGISTLHAWETVPGRRPPRVLWPAIARALKVMVEDITEERRVKSRELPGFTVDLFAEEPFDFESIYERALRVPLDRTEATVIGLADLIHLKRKSGRPQDLEDVRALTNLEGSEEPPHGSR